MVDAKVYLNKVSFATAHMQIHKDINNLPLFHNAVITIGTFDGVHTGHCQIFQQLKEEAAKISGETVIITFDPHPRMVLASASHDIKLLNTLDEKLELLSEQSIDHIVVVPFTIEFSEQSAEDYIRNFIVQYFHPHTIIIGYDHHFGKQRKGNYLLLEQYADEFHYYVKEIPEHILNEVIISSTKIRNAVIGNDIETANKFLGYSYFFEGVVVEGDKIGRTLGYRTANLQLNDPNKLIPGDGVYAVEVRIAAMRDNLIKIGMMNIGIRPTLGKTNRMIEVHIFDLDEDLYGKTLRVYLKYFLRQEIRFNNMEELREAIAKDEIKSRELLRQG